MILLIAFTLLVCGLAYLLLKPLYSPLRHIPGPKGWPILKNTIDMFSAKDLLHLFESWCEEFKSEGLYKFGAVHTLINELVIISNPKWAKEILSQPRIFHKSIILKTRIPLIENGLITSEGEQHRFQRKLLGKVFSSMNVNSYVPLLNTHSDILVELWKDLTSSRSEGSNIDVRHYFGNFALDVIGEIGFGYQFNAQTMPGNKLMKATKCCLSDIFNPALLLISKIFPFVWYLPFGSFHKIKTSRNISKELINEVIVNRRINLAAGTLTLQEENDMLSLMMKARDDETNTGFTDEVIKANCITFSFAGHDTTAGSLAWILFCFTKYPKYQHRARQEILDQLQGKKDLTIDDFLNIPFTIAFIKECLRCHAIIPKISRTLQKDYTFGSYVLPKGTDVLLPLLYFNFQDFDDGHEFRPERYMKEDNAGTLFTFGYGPYNCIGKHLAYLEMKIVIIKLLQNFEFSADSEFQTYRKRDGVTIQTTPEITIRVKTLKW